jgi:hypothetical protein
MNINDYKKVTDRIEPNEKCRDEVLNMNKRKYNIEQDINENVTGVEVRSGHGITKYIGIAAACVLVVGCIGTTGVLLHNSSKNVVQRTEVEEQVTTEDATEEATEEVTTALYEGNVECDYQAIATELTDRYLEADNILCSGSVSYDENDSIVFYTYDSTDEDWSNNYGGERKFCKVTDERFKSCQDIYDYYRANLASVMNKGNQYAEEYTMPDNYAEANYIDGSTMSSWLGGDVSKYELNSRVDLRPYSDDKYAEGNIDDAAFAINHAMYVEYNGQLYVSVGRTEYWRVVATSSYTTEPVVTQTTDNSFTVSRYLKSNYAENENIKYGEERVFYVILDNGEWKITNIGYGFCPESYSASAIQSYLEDKEEYNDIAIDFTDILTPLEVLDYNMETHTCKVHVVLHDINGVDAAEITAEVGIDPTGNISVVSADITRLK